MCLGVFFLQIPHAQSSGQDFIIKSIRSLCKVPFVPENVSDIIGLFHASVFQLNLTISSIT